MTFASALTMEGKFAGEGLQNIDEDDDMLSAMVRELVERNGIGESVDAVWKALNGEHQKLFPTIPNPAGDSRSGILPEVLIEAPLDPSRLVESALDSTGIVVFGQQSGPFAGKRLRARPSVPEQASLFRLN
jgi:hypothetical protein